MTGDNPPKSGPQPHPVPSSILEAFDFSSDEIHDWEIDFIREAAKTGKLRVAPHALTQALKRNIKLADVHNTVLTGSPASKDKPFNLEARKPGINFEDRSSTGAPIRVKVSFSGGYLVVTVHEL